MTEGNNNNYSNKPELRKISGEELQQILDDHKKWFITDGKAGKQADLSKTDLREANLQKANLFQADLQEADLSGAKLQKVNLEMAKLQKVNLTLVNLQKTDLRKANLDNANVTDVNNYRKCKYYGVRVSTCYGSPFFIRFAQDQAWLEEYEATRDTRTQRIWAYLWKETSDYGRSIWRWTLVSFLLAVIFGCIYFIMGPDHFHIREPLPEYPDPWGILSMLYYSVVTFTTLGFGDITPKTIFASGFVMLEVIFGYLMLGGLISIFSTKLARRS